MDMAKDAPENIEQRPEPCAPDNKRFTGALHRPGQLDGQTYQRAAGKGLQHLFLMLNTPFPALQQLFEAYHSTILWISSRTLPWRSITMPTTLSPKGRGSG